MLHDLLKAISNKDFLSAKGYLEGALQEKIASAIDNRRLEVVDKLFNPSTEVKEDVISEDTLAEQKHVVLMTLSDPNHTMVSKRKELIQRRASVTAADREGAINAAHAFYKKQGYKVHDHHYVGLKEEADQNFNEGAFSSGALKAPKSWLAAAKKIPSTGTIRDKDEKGVYTAKTVNGKEVSRVYDTKEEVSLEEAVSIESKARYEYTNGKKPKGSGQWMFSTVHPKDHDVSKHKDQTHSVSGNFSDAAKTAAKHFKAMGHKGEIHVLS